MLDVALTIEQWQDYAAALIQASGNPEVVSEGAGASRGNGALEGPHHGHRMLSVQSGQGHIYGVSAYWLKPDLRRDRVMEIENFAVVDVTGTRRAARTLLDGLESLARQADCSCIVVSLLNPMIRRRLRDEQEATADLFKASGFQGDYQRLRKCFDEPV